MVVLLLVSLYKGFPEKQDAPIAMVLLCVSAHLRGT